ncbi:hypothetical protein NXC14_PC00028 (plasmid) [Rhizobium sp. NXC14]|nr:hypothetical protein NXC14_PC00028 [Rhizobium sp. NXC14]
MGAPPCNAGSKPNQPFERRHRDGDARWGTSSKRKDDTHPRRSRSPFIRQRQRTRMRDVGGCRALEGVGEAVSMAGAV